MGSRRSGAAGAKSGALNEAFSDSLEPALRGSDLVYIALAHRRDARFAAGNCAARARRTRWSRTLPAPSSASRKLPRNFSRRKAARYFLGGHPMAGRELSGFEHADAELFRNATYALDKRFGGEPRSARGRVRENSGENGRAPAVARRASSTITPSGWLRILPQLAAVALASFLYDHLDENGLPITLAGPGLRDSLRLAGSPYATWRDIVLTNREVLSVALDLFARRLDDIARTPRLPRTGSRFRRRQRTLQTPAQPVVWTS